MRKPLFTGVCTALVTPFRNNDIDVPMLKILLERQIQTGVRAIVIAGTTGEGSTLTDEEKIMLIKESKAYVQDRCLIIAGTGSNDTAHCIKLSQEAETAGADGILVVSPYYNKTTPDGLCKHYSKIAESVSIPIILYNVPSRTGLDIPVSVYQELSKIPNIVGVKEANTNITKITNIRNACGAGFGIWSGNDDQIVPVLSMGGHGVISVLSNVKPSTTVHLCTAALSGDYKTAALLQCQLQPLVDALFSEVNPIPVKAAMKAIGLDCGGCRLPLCDISHENEMKLRQALQ